MTLANCLVYWKLLCKYLLLLSFRELSQCGPSVSFHECLTEQQQQPHNTDWRHLRNCDFQIWSTLRRQQWSFQLLPLEVSKMEQCNIRVHLALIYEIPLLQQPHYACVIPENISVFLFDVCPIFALHWPLFVFDRKVMLEGMTSKFLLRVRRLWMISSPRFNYYNYSGIFSV